MCLWLVSLPQSALYDVLLLKTLRVHAPETPSPRLPNPWAACHAAPEVVLSGPRCNKFVNRLFKFLVFFYKLKYICHQNAPKLHLLLLLWAYDPKTCFKNASKIRQLFRFGLHPYKLATLRATIGLIITSCYRIKRIKIKGFVMSQ